MKCRFCGKEITDKETAYKVGKSSYYCNEECYNQTASAQKKLRDKYKPTEGSDRLEYTDYIQSIYLDNGYDKSEIPWTFLMAQTKNILAEHKTWSYTTLQYILYYMYEILGLNLFTDISNGNILSLLPFYGLEAEKYYKQCNDIEQKIEQFEFNEDKIVVKKANRQRNKHKMINMETLI